MSRVIESPGVQITEVDLSLNQQFPVGTNIFAVGYTAQGPTDELINVTSISEFEQVFGIPSTPAERYLYHTARQILQANANLLVTRLPYGSGEGVGYGNNYSALVFPTFPVPGTGTAFTVASAGYATSNFADASAFYIGQPTHLTLNETQYQSIINNNIAWSSVGGGLAADNTFTYNNMGRAAMVVLNQARTTIDNNFAGYYVAVSDNTSINPATDFNAVTGIKTVDATSTFSTIADNRLTFSTTQPATGIAGSTSEIIASVPSFDFHSEFFNDSLIVSLFKIRPTIYAQDPLNLDQVLVEAHVGSLNANRKIGGKDGKPATFFLENIVNDNSAYLKVLVNPYISKDSDWEDSEGNTKKITRVLRSDVPTTGRDRTTLTNYASSGWLLNADNAYALGIYTPKSKKETKDIGNVVTKLKRALALAENTELVPIDLTVEAGLGTIWTTAKAQTSLALGTRGDYTFDDTVYVDTTDLLVTTGDTVAGIQDHYETIFNAFQGFAEDTRKDHLYLADPLRQLFVNGPNTKVMDLKSSIFSKNIYWGLRNLYQSANSSYCATYGNWMKAYDDASDTQVWLPPSGFIAAVMARTEVTGQPWTPAAGLQNGIITGITDIAVNPTQKHRDLLYKIGVNPVVFFPTDGFAVWGQKTMLRRPTAFDRINVRRLFNTLEKSSQRVLRYFVMQPNTIFTRTRLKNTLAPVFELAKNTDGLYDYLIICDERNNTPEVIDRNELVVDIYIKPARAAEFILVNFVGTRSGQNFSELI